MLSSPFNGGQSIPPSQNLYLRVLATPIHSILGMSPSGESLSPFRTHEEIREARYIDRISRIVGQLPAWKEERLPPPRVSQSQYDKVGLTRM